MPGINAHEFMFEILTDWSGEHSGYMLLAQRNGEDRLVDLGSRAHKNPNSSYLGKLDIEMGLVLKTVNVSAVFFSPAKNRKRIGRFFGPH